MGNTELYAGLIRIVRHGKTSTPTLKFHVFLSRIMDSVSSRFDGVYANPKPSLNRNPVFQPLLYLFAANPISLLSMLENILSVPFLGLGDDAL